jgi:hypothetical protein
VSPKVKSLAARSGEHQKKFLAAGGKPWGLKYPVPWQVERLKASTSRPWPGQSLGGQRRSGLRITKTREIH